MKPRAVFKLLRPHNCFFAGIGVLIGAIIASGGIPHFTAGFAFAAAFFVSGAGYAVNDYADRKIDAVNNPKRPIPSGELTPSDALGIARILFVLGILSSAFINLPCLFLAGFNAALLAYYASDLKRRGLIGNITISYLVGSTFLFGALVIGSLTAAGILAAMAGLSTAGRELIKDVEDIRGDRKSDSKTFPIRYGKKKTVGLAIILTIGAIILSPLPYLLGIFGWPYLTIVGAAIGVFIIGMTIIARRQRKKDAHHASLAYKIAMGLGLIAFLVGAII
ncbi:hypothetical protein AKJ44_00975 [candidate division MSBL1 archaeon SCGC-AAA261F17]|uniref:Digeranylgeranylglyceryl phosphate synthase n=1 Tax=candidate division MSBL1 archaeon SCGC-AAA261F17 TaxID=1698274 RepID=A0A133V768_9EURY|nr:hypothetical protein AKJ44_00975 [candidate division MSBL1 archaeon SCGC-AAA261F17]